MTAPTFTETEDSIYDLLEWIHRRPGIWIAQPELVRVYSFIGGYEAALGRQRLALRSVAPEFRGFHDWIAQRLGYGESTSGWYNMIRGRCSSEREAFDRFYELLAEFRASAGAAA
jgi:hypothetical protein